MHVIHFMHELAGCLYMYYIIFKIADWLPLPGIQNLKADFEGKLFRTNNYQNMFLGK